MKLFNVTSMVAVGAVAALGFLSQPSFAMNKVATAVQATPYAGEQGAIDFSKSAASTQMATGLDQVNQLLGNYGLSMVVPAGVSNAFTGGITAQIKTIQNGQISDDVTDSFNKSTYNALVVTLPKGHGYEMDNRDVFIIGKIPAAQTAANGGLLNAFAYMSGRDSQAPALSITTQAGLALSASNPHETTINNTTPDVGDVTNPVDYQTLIHDQGNASSPTLFFNTIAPTGAWWDDYYTDNGGVYKHTDTTFSDWKSTVTNWYPTTQQDAYFSLALPYGDTAKQSDLNETFQISYIGYGQGYAPDINEDFANAFPNRPIYFGDENIITYAAQSGVNWWDQNLQNNHAPVLRNGSNHAVSEIDLDDGWEDASYVTKDAAGHAAINFPEAYNGSTHIQVSDAENTYYVHNGYPYTFTADVTAADKNGQPVAISSSDTDLPTLIYSYSNSGTTTSSAAYANGEITLNFTANCPKGINGIAPTYCPAVFSVYKGYNNGVDNNGRSYVVANPVVHAGTSYTVGGQSFWLNVPGDQYWDGSKVFYADFHNLKHCADNDNACIAHDQQIEDQFSNGFMSLQKQWGGESGGTDSHNLKLQPADANGDGHLALTESNVPTVSAENILFNMNDVNTYSCNQSSKAYSPLNCADAKHFVNWYQSHVEPLSNNPKYQDGVNALHALLLNAGANFDHSLNGTTYLIDLNAAYTPKDPSNCKTVVNNEDLCPVKASSVPSYCMVGGANKCVVLAPNTSSDHPKIQKIMAALNVRTGSGVIARNRAASGRYMMCVKMPKQSGASFSSWLYGFENFKQGDPEWLHQTGAKRNSEIDFMESSYYNPALTNQPIQAAESDFGSYGGMNANTGSASYRDYYHVPASASGDQYVWMGYDYHTGTITSTNFSYDHADTHALYNAQASLLGGGATQSNLDAVQNTRSGDYVDIYVDPTVNCTTDGINDSNFDAIWNKHATEANKVMGESQSGKALPHTIMGDSKGIGWLPYRYTRWTVALWNPAMLTQPKDAANPYIGWAGTPLGSYVDSDLQTHSLEADISYLAMEPKTDPRDKAEFDTGSTYWNNQYDDSALNMHPAPSFSCDGTVYPIKVSDGNPDTTKAFADGGLVATLTTDATHTPLKLNSAEPGLAQVCIPKDGDFSKLHLDVKTSENATPATMDCFSNNSSVPNEADVHMHGVGPNAYMECQFAHNDA